MTRIAGEKIIEAPCCGERFRTPSYASINFSAREFWTDGRKVGSLFDNDGGLRRCKCNSFFLLNQARVIGSLPKRKLRAPENWEKKSNSAWHLFWGFPTRDSILSFYDTRDSTIIDAEEFQLDSLANRVDDIALTDIISSNYLSREIEIVARRRYWRYLNDGFRETYRTSREVDHLQIPIFLPTSEQQANMERLLSLLIDQLAQDWTEIAELMRELGDLKSAKSVLSRADQSYAEIVALQNQLINQGLHAPVRFRY
jgi:hypothetical protein